MSLSSQLGASNRKFHQKSLRLPVLHFVNHQHYHYHQHYLLQTQCCVFFFSISCIFSNFLANKFFFFRSFSSLSSLIMMTLSCWSIPRPREVTVADHRRSITKFYIQMHFSFSSIIFCTEGSISARSPKILKPEDKTAKFNLNHCECLFLSLLK